MNREELRVAAMEAIQSHNNIAIQAATGVGKSRIAFDLCNLVQAKRILLVVAERAHKLNWSDEKSKWSFPTPLVTVCYTSLHKYQDTEWDVVIFDEAHHLNTEKRLAIFETIKAQHMIFLSATLKDSLIINLEDSCGHIHSIKLGLQEAFDSEILPEPKIVLVPLVLDNTKMNQTIIEEWGKKDRRVSIKCLYKDRWHYLRKKRQYPNTTLTIICTQQQKYNYITEQFEYYKKRYMMTRNEIIKNKWLQCGTKRKRFLGELKTDIVRSLIDKVKDKRFICFCTSIEQAEKLGGTSAIHSKNKKTPEIIQKFNNKKISNMFAVGMLQEGQNLTDIEVGIIVQLDGEERAFIQKFGRTLRADSPVQYIIYYKDTRDEEYLNKAIESINKEYITVLKKN